MSAPKTVFIDTNIFIRVITKDDPKKAEDCRWLFEKIENNKLYGVTSNLVLAEVTWTLQSAYKIKKEECIDLLKGIVGIKQLKIVDGTDSLQALALYEKYRVKYIDAMIAAHDLIQAGVPIVSYDTDFDTLSIQRFEPQKLLRLMK